MKVGFFGGTFDPIHYGHINLALSLKESTGLDEVWFCPAYVNPFKLKVKSASAEDRLAMLQLAIQGIDGFKVIENEIDKSEPSYTIDTMIELRHLYPHTFYLLLGEDQLKDFGKWKEAERLKEMAPLLVGRRGDGGEGVAIPRFDISATQIRERLRNHLYVGHLLPPPVLEYIHKKGLYAKG